MLSPEISKQTKTNLEPELSSSFDKMIRSKIEIIKGGIVIHPSADEKIYSIGLGFAVTNNN